MSRDELIRTVMQQLPGLPEPRIMVMVAAGTRTMEEEAELFAEHHQQPIAIVSTEGKLLAYRVPVQS